jgi:Fe-S-cluster containining protein
MREWMTAEFFVDDQRRKEYCPFTSVLPNFLSMEKYECDHCGACCRQLLVEAYWIDVAREPRLIEADRHAASKSVDAVLDELEEEYRCLLISGSRPCPFLDQENKCGIYPTRPNACVAMEAGDAQCQASRKREGLPPLLPKEPLKGD